MKTVLFSLALLSPLMAHAAEENLSCKPAANNSSFTENVSLAVLSASEIEVNKVKLKLDETYAPRTMKDFKRYVGDTTSATGWSDSGSVEVLYSAKEKRLNFRVQGEAFTNEFFSCK